VIQTSGYLSPATLLQVRAPSDYIASAAHYECVARRILVALRGSNRPFVLVTGDPPPDPEGVLEALGKVAGPGHAATIIPCRPELRREDLDRATPPRPPRTAVAGAETDQGSSAHASPIFIFDDFDQLSDKQIKNIVENHDQNQQAAILLAPADFLDRLERLALRFLNDRIAAQFRFQGIGDDEAIAFLHNQLLSQADRRVEARGFYRGILAGLAVGGAALVAAVAFFILHPISEGVHELSAIGKGRDISIGETALMIQPIEGLKTTGASARVASGLEVSSENKAALSPSSAPSAKEADAPILSDRSVEGPPGPRLSGVEVSMLLGRGDALLGTGDTTSARLFYERAADGGSGLAALRLGATFDPALPRRTGMGTAADPAQALFWYRRARDLSITEAETRINRIENRKGAMSDALSR